MERYEKTRSALSPLFPSGHESEAVGTEESEADSSPQQRLPGVVVTEYSRTGSHLDVVCLPDQLMAVAGVLEDEGFFLESIAGVDWLEQGQLEIIYDFNLLGGDQCRVMVRTFVDRSEPVVPTLTGIFPAADWHERETFDFYGLHFQGHPDLTRILLPEDADYHPLLKDFMP
ncbi:NADH-quinone oxidoreductase subunit C [Desulfobulbus alkaliphilus]|uniref:NADH-quinone oxidoreductase subunit C n=1 Tax=Desulfobulbus alkaliphilus TaxID=869814 RepID=UPI0019668CAE|nr:NADH-quinone oxidoreductase subunit C [Desulfobulbus alkaliphilus]MBM9538025.1 NADH-quinone oxidoreductase subunit C [Desulfobulbus alkaliphilus]